MNNKNTAENLTIDYVNENRGHLYRQAIEDTERTIIEKALEVTHGNKISAARILGINRNTIHFKTKKLGIEVQRFK